MAVARFGCPLCGGHHELQFHSYPLRWSVGSDGKRQQIHVATILCGASRGPGQAYTKRILPEHLIPRSPFSFEKLVKLLEGQHDGEPGFIEAACEALSCVDPRTARKHLCLLRKAAELKLVLVAELLASAPGPSEGRAVAPDTNPLLRLSLLWGKFLDAAQALSGSLVALSLKPLLWVGPGLESWSRFHRSCIPIAEVP